MGNMMLYSLHITGIVYELNGRKAKQEKKHHILRKGKPAERRRRKAAGLQHQCQDCRAAEVTLKRLWARMPEGVYV